MAIVGTMSALVVSLLISNASRTYSARNNEVTRLSADVIQLDHLLRRYGLQADEARTALQHFMTMTADDLFGQRAAVVPSRSNPDALAMLDHAQDLVLALQPSDNWQHWLANQALQLSAELDQTRWLAVQANGNSFPLPFLGGVVIWLAILFASFGLFAPRHATTVLVLLCAALVASSAVKMLLDMDSPFTGYPQMTGFPIRVSAEPIRHALEIISRPGS